MSKIKTYKLLFLLIILTLAKVSRNLLKRFPHPGTDMTPFGVCVERLRRSRGFQQQQLAAEIGINSCYLSNIENGRKGPPSIQIISRLIEALELTPEEEEELNATQRQSKQKRDMPRGAGLHEYVFIEQLWQRLGTLSVAEAEALTKVLLLKNDQRGQAMIT